MQPVSFSHQMHTNMSGYRVPAQLSVYPTADADSDIGDVVDEFVPPDCLKPQAFELEKYKLRD